MQNFSFQHSALAMWNSQIRVLSSFSVQTLAERLNINFSHRLNDWIHLRTIHFYYCHYCYRHFVIVIKPCPMRRLDTMSICNWSQRAQHHGLLYTLSLASIVLCVCVCSGKPMKEWGAGLMNVLPRALTYVESQGRDVDDNKRVWSVKLHGNLS